MSCGAHTPIAIPPGSIAVSIDIAASTDPEHSMTVAIGSLKKMMRKRRNKCVLSAQVVETQSARAFWSDKLTKTKRASVMAALFSGFDDFDNRSKIYCTRTPTIVGYGALLRLNRSRLSTESTSCRLGLLVPPARKCVQYAS